MTAFSVCGSLKATPGNGDVLQRYLLDAAAALEATDACHLYLVNRVAGEPDVVWVIEVWDDEDAHLASLELDAMRRMIERARWVIAAMPQHHEMQTIGGKGLQLPGNTDPSNEPGPVATRPEPQRSGMDAPYRAQGSSAPLEGDD